MKPKINRLEPLNQIDYSLEWLRERQYLSFDDLLKEGGVRKNKRVAQFGDYSVFIYYKGSAAPVDAVLWGIDWYVFKGNYL